jgi:DNA-binding transcriptional MerR regulator
MKDLCQQTGLDRQTIHFYIQQGLVPEGHKTGRNMAYYGADHVQRIVLVRRLQRERFLPLKAIKAVLDGQDDHFSDDQRALFSEVKRHLGSELGAGDEPRATVDAEPLLKLHGVEARELEAMARVGLLSTLREGDRTLVLEDDVWMIEHWGRMRAAGFTEDLGFVVEDLAVFEETVSQLFENEKQLLAPRVAHLPPAEVATMVRRALPLVNDFLSRYHLTKARNFFSAIE